MRYEFLDRVRCSDTGSRVTVRSRTDDGYTTDVVGVLEACDERAMTIRTKRGNLIQVERGLIVASKVIPS